MPTLRQQIIAERIKKTADLLGTVNESLAFLRLSHAVITGQSLHEFDDNDLVDGGQDKGIDLITIEEQDGFATVFILQIKHVTTFKSNELIHLKNGLDWLFKKPLNTLKTLKNQRLRDRISDWRNVQLNLGPACISVIVNFITIGDTSEISDEFQQELKSIQSEYDNNTYEAFTVSALGANELLDLISDAEKHKKKIDVSVRIKYDTNCPSLIRYYSGGLKGMVCSAPASEIARVVNDDKSGYVFDSNIRRFLGSRGAVNSAIFNACSGQDDGNLFWFLNNGITIACDSFDPVTDPDNACVKIRNIQIVNGCQTAMTLAQAKTENLLPPDVWVLLRIYQTTENSIVDKIVLSTNHQNKITSRDLRSNDQVQVEMEVGFKSYALLYERKTRQYDRAEGINGSQIVTNEQVAQSYVAVVMKKPSDARRRKYRVWGDLYEKIFKGGTIEPYVFACLLCRLVMARLRASGATAHEDELTRRLAKNGAYHVARITGYLITKDDYSDAEQLKHEINVMRHTPRKLDPTVDEALKGFISFAERNPAFKGNIDGAMKSNTLDADLDRELHSLKKRRRVR